MRALNRLFIVPAALIATTMAAPAQQAEPGPGPRHMDPAVMHKHMCDMHYAETAGHLASLEALLDLNAQQKPLWDKWSQGLLDRSKTARKECQAEGGKDMRAMTALDIEARMEKHLADEAAALKASRPALEALYNGLNPDQKKILDHAAMMHGMHGRHEMGKMMMHHEMHEEAGHGGMTGPQH